MPRESFQQPPTEEKSGDFRSGLGNKVNPGHGSPREKRSSMVEYAARLNKIMSILPHDAKLRLANRVESLKKNPEEVINDIKYEIEANRIIIDMYYDKTLTADEALKELNKLIPPPETVH